MIADSASGLVSGTSGTALAAFAPPLAQETILSPQSGYVLLALFGILWVSLGIWWGRRATSYDGFAVAGRNVGLALATGTAVATWITSNTTMLAQFGGPRADLGQQPNKPNFDTRQSEALAFCEHGFEGN